MNPRLDVAIRLGTAAGLAATAYLHADLCLYHGYRMIRFVGPGFLLLSSAGFALAVLFVFGSPVILRLTAAGLMLGTLGGFLASRTFGVFGFVERGLQPAPQALISLIVESAVLVLLAMPVLVRTATRDPIHSTVDKMWRST